MRRVIRITLISVSLLAIFYLIGPKPAVPAIGGTLPYIPENVDAYVRRKEAGFHLKPDNQARIVWMDSLHRKTPYSIVYLHGFSASEREGDPVHNDFARKYGYNMFLSRLNAHGIDTSEALVNMTAQGLWKDAQEALAVGKLLGNKVILIGTSTGGTLALLLAAQYPNDVAAVINLSPNIAINDDMVFMADEPWGLQVARLVKRSKYNESKPEPPDKAKYWYVKYRLEAVTELESLVSNTMKPETFRRIHQPVLNLYYYKNEQEQDPTVRVSAILAMHKQLGTPDSLKQATAIPGAGNHVIGSSLVSKAVPEVETAITQWWDRIVRYQN